MTSLPAFQLPDEPASAQLTPGQQVAAAIAEVAELMNALESGKLAPSAGSVLRLQRATAELEALVARLP